MLLAKQCRINFLPICILCSVLLCSGCGGGGGAVSAGQSCVPTSDHDCISQADYGSRRKKLEDAYKGQASYKNQWGLDNIKAGRAWAQLELAIGKGTRPGSGQTVGIIDSGIDRSHPAFSGKRVHEHFFNGAIDERGTRFSHGTAVASVIAGNPTDSRFIKRTGAASGVAWGANIAMFALPTGSGGGLHTPLPTSLFPDVDTLWVPRMKHVINWSQGTLDFVNVSLGYPGIIDHYSTLDLRNGFDNLIPTLAQSGRKKKTIFVISAGNAHRKFCNPADFTGTPGLCVEDPKDRGQYRVNARSPEIFAGLPARIPELRGIVLAVVATDSSGRITDFSNRCGLAASSCLAAPGYEIEVAYFGPEPRSGSRDTVTANGTSFSAPMVTGALVVLKQLFRGQRSNQQLVQRLLDTADDRGRYADSSIYGHGLLDLAAATAPQGETRFVSSGQISDVGDSIGQTWFNTSNALGDGLNRSIAGQEIVAFDNQDFPFWYSLGKFAPESSGSDLKARLHEFMAPTKAETELDKTAWEPSLGWFENKQATGNLRDDSGMKFLDVPVQSAFAGHLSLAGRAFGLTGPVPDNWVLTAFSNKGMDQGSPVVGAVMSWKHTNIPLKARFGFMSEQKSLLRSHSNGAFGGMSTNSVFAGIEGSMQMGSWQLGAGAEIGSAVPDTAGGIISDISVLATSTFAVRAFRSINRRQSLSLHIAQPLRVESGHARLTVPVGVNPDDTVVTGTFDASLQPTGRQIELGVQWQYTVKNAGDLRLGLVRIHDPNHSKGARPENLFMIGWRKSF